MPQGWICDNEPSEHYPIYTRGNIGEVYPEPVTPLSWSWGVVPCAEPGWRDAWVRFGAFDADEFDPDRLEILGYFGGYGFLNVSLSRIFAVRVPGLTPELIDQSIFGAQPGVPPYQPGPGDERPDLTARVQGTLQWILTAGSLPELLDDQRTVADLRANRPDVATLADRDLIEAARDQQALFRHLFAQHIFTTYCSTVPAGIITSTCAALGDPSLAMRLIAGIGDVDSAAPSWAMWRLGRTVAGSPALGRAFDAGVDGLLDRLRALPEADGFLSAFGEFLYAYGSRGANEWETRAPTWETEPHIALAAIDRMRLAPEGGDPQQSFGERAADREAVGDEVAGRLRGDPEGEGQLRAALAAAKVFLAGRERSKTNVIRQVHEIRVLTRELGRRMRERGAFDEVGSFAMITDEEYDDFLAAPDAFSATVRERERQFAELKELVPPFVFAADVPSLDGWARRGGGSVERASSGTVLTGMSGCPGVARGRARVVLDPADPSALEPGDVLVAPITDPAWTPLFVSAAAVVVDVGAPLSHAVIVSRELGIPCVVSVTDATRRIADGATVIVDGTNGTVTIA